MNAEHYRDPMPAETMKNANRERSKKRREQELEEMQTIEDYETAVRAIREVAEQRGFHFAGGVWLVSDKTGRTYKSA
jgi:ribosome-binding protein aMBF1 (putative translation factor)